MAVVVLVVVVLVQLPASSPDRPSTAATPSGSVFTFRTDATASELREAGGVLIESYGAFLVARGTESTVGELTRLGRYADPTPRASYLELRNGPIDVRSRAPSRDWRLNGQGLAVGVVHFVAPIKPEWKIDLEGRGITVLRYLPQDALIVRGTLAGLEAVASWLKVDWVGPYDPSWKIRTGPLPDDLVDVRVVVFPGENPEEIEAWLGHSGVRSIDGAFGSGDFRWVRARVPSGLLPSLAALASVEFIDPVAPVHVLNAQTDWVLQTNNTDDYRYWNIGLDARGQVIGMSDTGLDYDGPPFRQGSPASNSTIGDIYNVTNMNRRKVVRYLDMGVLTGALTWPGGGGLWDPWSAKDCANGHGTGVASTLAGNDAGLGTSPNDGNALLGKIYLEDIGGFQGSVLCPNEGLIYLPENYADLFGPAGLVYNDPIAPVRIHTNSWGADTNDYDVGARMVDAFVWAHPDLTILFAAGNAGNAAGSVGTPATAKDIVSVGGAYNPDPFYSEDQNDLADQSSRGPTLDGRIKPTVLAIFDGDSAMSDGDPSSGAGNPDAHWSGTSYATPAAAAAAAIVRQYFTDGWYPAGRPVAGNGMSPSAALIRAMLIASGVQVTGFGTVSRSPTDTWPNNEQGFGRILLSKVLPVASMSDTFRTQVVDGTEGLLTGDDATYTFRVPTAGPVKFVLTWSDYPGTLGAAKALVNDLNLQVTGPDGSVYRGNHFAPFAQGQSLVGGSFDTTNVEEAVILKFAMAGEWTVQVIGSNIPIGPQPFALVATGSLDSAYGRVALDRVAYSEADAIQISVEDSDATSVTVNMASGIEPSGEDVPLSRGAVDGIWRGTIRTAFGASTADGILQVQEGDTILAAYTDASPAHSATARARVLASGPTIHDVTVGSIGATSATVRWVTDQPATTEVAYGLAPLTLSLSVSSPELRTDHAIALSQLAPDTDYYLEASSRGRLGNRTTDTNGGLTFRFHTAPWGDVLLVVGGESFPVEREASYEAALDGKGWSWSIWRVADLGLPPLGILQDRRAVIWQVGLEQYPPFDATARSLVQTYLDRGGRLLVVSHDTTWALGDPSSQFSTSSSQAWVRGVLKATFRCDPTTITQVSGQTSDPISGAYTSGVAYTPHRGGGADDEFAPNNAGGVSSVVWTDGNGVTGCTPPNQPIGLRWVSGAANGTTGVGVWGGARSRLVYFAFELTGVDATLTDLNPSSATRAIILDQALRWLVGVATATLDRDHPDVTITAPNGGTFTGSSIPVNWTAAAYGSGIGLANFTISSSPDSGQTWAVIASLPETARTFTWSLGSTENGNRYLLRILAQDNGTPSLAGIDVTSVTFTIARPGGDSTGPVLWAGSVRVAPRPADVDLPATFTGTADDRARGASPIERVELFLSLTEPAAADTGTGIPMTAVDGAFDSALENVSWQGGLAAGPGAICAWIHAHDAAGNWGPYGSTCFVVILVGPGTASVDGMRFANGGADLQVEWAAAWDEGFYGGTVEYHVLRAGLPGGPYADVSGAIPANGSARYGFLDPNRGADASDYFYRVETLDASNNTANSTTTAVKTHLAFLAGLNLLGIPVQLTNSAFGSLASGGAWADAWTYDACASGFPWASALPSDGSTFALPIGRGFWLNGTAPDSLTALGVVAKTSQVRLCGGWNLVALPGFAAGVTVQALKAATGALEVMGFDPLGPTHVRDLADSDVLVPGRGYWVRVAAGVTWTVPGW